MVIGILRIIYTYSIIHSFKGGYLRRKSYVMRPPHLLVISATPMIIYRIASIFAEQTARRARGEGY